MGVVYRAIDLNLATTVAIKTLPKDKDLRRRLSASGVRHV